MWGEHTKARVARAAAGVLSEYADADRLMHYIAKLQHLRTLLDEGASAFWHFGAMPSRQDVRLVQRRVSALRRRVAELDRALATLESIEGEREEDARERERNARDLQGAK